MGRLAGYIALAVGAASGFLEFLGPQSSIHSPFIPGLLVIGLACPFILAGHALRNAWRTDAVYAGFALVSLLVFVVMLLIYAPTYYTITVEIDAPSGSSMNYFRRIKGDQLTVEGEQMAYEIGEGARDVDLVSNLGAPERVWSTYSINRYWRLGLWMFASVAVSAVLLVYFLGLFGEGGFDIEFEKKTKKRPDRRSYTERAREMQRERDRRMLDR